MRIFFALFTVFLMELFLVSCGSIVPQQPLITNETLRPAPQVTSTVKIPLEINLSPYFDLVDKSLPKTFKGNEEQCDGVSFQYYFIRKPLLFNGVNKKLSYQILGEYNIRANYCAQCSSVFGSDPFCLTPRIYVSCGVGEPLRKLEINFESEISIASNYQLKSKTKLISVKPVDPCELTFFKYDASKLIEEEMSSYLKTLESDIDDQIEKVDLLTPVSQAWKVMQESIDIPGIGHLYFQPRSVEIEPITFSKQKANININMELSPIFSSDSIFISKPSLPVLSKVPSKENFNLPLLTLLSYDSLNAIFNQEISGMVIPFKKKKIIISELKALGPVGKQLLFKVDFSGSKKGTIYLLGTPYFDQKTKEISFPDLTFDLRTHDAILKSAKWMFDKKLTDTFRNSTKFDLTEQMENGRLEIEKQLNTKIEYQKGEFVSLSGNLSSLNLSDLQVGANELRVIVNIEGNLSLKL